MSNPFFSRSAAFNGRGPAAPAQTVTPNGYPTMPGYQPGHGRAPGQQPGYGQAPAGYGQAGPQSVSPQQLSQLEAQYGAPSATNVDRGRMTYDDVIIRTAGIFAMILVVGALSWNLVSNPDTVALGYPVMIVGAVGALVLGLVNSFKKEPSPVLIMLYALFEGAMLGAISGVMEILYPGIVVQAVLATLATFTVMLCAYKFAGFRVVDDPWGLRGVEIMGIPLGLIIGVLAVAMASFSLAMDFEAIQRGVERGLPTKYAWAGAFGLVVTIVWLYVEFLRILAILRDN